jgi:gliding motility-associated-like protein
VKPIPVISLKQNPAICFGTSTGNVKVTILSGKAPYSYLWSQGSTNDSIYNLPSGLFKVMVTDSNNCSTIDSILVTQPDSISSIINPNIIPCYGDSTGKAKVFVQGGVGILNYLWSTSSTKDSIEGVKEGWYYLTIQDVNRCKKIDSVYIPQRSKLSLMTKKMDSVSCYGENDGGISVSMGGAYPPYSYQWNSNPSLNSPAPSGLKAGMYSLKVSDSFNCLFVDTLYVYQPDKISRTYQVDKAISCFNGSDGAISILASGGTPSYTYDLGNGPQSNPRFTNLSRGNYIVTITDSKKCSDTITIHLAEPSKISFSLGKINSSCMESANGKAFINSISGGTIPYSILWSNASISDTANYLGGKTWAKVTIRDGNNCSQSDSVFISADYQLNVISSFDSVYCYGGSDGKAFVRPVNGIGPYRYLWNTIPAQLTDSAEGLKKGIYLVTVTDRNNCIRIDTVDVPQPKQIKAKFINTMPSCYLKTDGIMKIEAYDGYSPYTYIWRTSPIQMGATAYNLSSDTFTVEIIDLRNCHEVVRNFLSQPPQSLKIRLLERKEISCFGEEDGYIKITATGGRLPYRYNWNTIERSQDSFQRNLKPNERYKVTVNDLAGCIDTSSYIFAEPPKLELKVYDVTPMTCPNSNDGSFKVRIRNGAEPYRISLDSFVHIAQSNYFTYMKDGMYKVYAMDANRCQTSESIEILKPEGLQVEITSDTDTKDLCSALQLNTLLTNTNGVIPNEVSYRWTPSTGLTCSDCPDPIVNSYVTKDYSVDVYYHNDRCRTSDTIRINVNNNNEIFIPNAFSPDGDGVNDNFRFYGNCILSSNLKVFNRWGEKVFEGTNQIVGWDGKYKGEYAQNGVYSYILFVTFLNKEKNRFTGEFLFAR